MSHIVMIDNQEIPIDPETASSDHEIRQALKWCYPEISNATINRRTEGEREIITIIKRAGTKGIWELESNSEKSGETANTVAVRTLDAVVRALSVLPEEVNPAVRLAFELQERMAANELTLGQLVLKRAEMQEALNAGEEEEAQVEQARVRLMQSPPQAPCAVPVGF